MWTKQRILACLFIIGIVGNLLTTLGTFINPNNETTTKTFNTVFGFLIFGFFLLDSNIRNQLIHLKGAAKPILFGSALYFSNLYLDPAKISQLVTVAALVILYQAFPLKIKDTVKLFLNKPI